MLIKTLTTYDVYNYGASLQAYALQRYLIEKGHSVEIINYQPEYLTRKYNYKWVNPESKMSKYAITRFIYRIAKFIQRQTTLGRKRQFDRFNHEVLIETKNKYTTYKELCENPPIADLYIVGSDQIWNVFYETGRDAAFYLDFVKEGNKASYAASFSYLNIPNNELNRIKNSLSTFKGVAVREYQGIDILNKIGIKGTWVLDPVFLISPQKWIDFLTPMNFTEKYLLIYDFEGNKELEKFAIEYSRIHNLKIYAIVDTYPLKYADKNFKSAGPEDFVSLIHGCSAFISNSFHGTAFSIIFHKPVFVFNRHRHKVNSRMESLLKLFELEDCIISDNMSFNANLNRIFDFSRIEIIKENELKKSREYLDNLLYENK